MNHHMIFRHRDLLVNKDVLTNSWQNVWEWGMGGRAYALANSDYKVSGTIFYN